MAPDFQAPKKEVPLLTAHDTKPAGDKMYIGVQKPKTKNNIPLPLAMRPKKIESSNKRNVHDIFKMPKSMGGQVDENARKTG
jgi:hypothetical protein